MQQTISIIKPDAVQKGVFGEILTRFERAGLKVVAMKMKQLSTQEAEEFYEMHKERPFYGDLVSFMTSGPVVMSILEGQDAVKRHRDLMGATNPKEALAGTLRADYAQSIDANAVHGSDSEESAQREISLLFGNQPLA